MCLSSKGLVKDWEKFRCIQVENLCWGTRFLSRAFEHFYIDIWLCMLLEDVLEILLLLMPKTFIDEFVFVWGHEQCTTTTSQFTCLVYYYLKDLDQVHLAYRGLLYGDKDQTLLIDDAPSKARQNPK
jgi:hypothetical protein